MIRLLPGDCRDVLPTLPDASVQCVVTSPPYFGLRDYGTAQWEGGSNDCDHVAKQPKRGNAAYTNGQGGSFSSNLQAWGDRDVSTVYRDICGKCGARRIDRQIGLEATPEAFIAELVAVFRLVRRVLRDDGTVWLNMGDSYASGEVGRHDHKQAAGICVGDATAGRSFIGNGMGAREQRALSTGLPAKNLLMMPARVALALQADGWWVRSDIIISKRNPMPESVRDRPVSSHEHLFLLTKSARYFWDAEAVREPQSEGTHERFGKNPQPSTKRKLADAGNGIKNNDSFDAAMKTMVLPNGRNMRNVWEISTFPYKEAHFATFSPELPERCIRAGTSERGCCASCGAPWVRVVEKPTPPVEVRTQRRVPADGMARSGFNIDGQAMGSGSKLQNWLNEHPATTTGWSPSCTHDAPTQPCVVLDPFSGAGTTCLVADRLGRDSIGIDLSHAYVEMARERLHADCPLFADISPAPAEDPEDERMADLFAMAAD